MNLPPITKAPEWLKEARRRNRMRPPPTEEEVRQTWEASGRPSRKWEQEIDWKTDSQGRKVMR